MMDYFLHCIKTLFDCMVGVTMLVVFCWVMSIVVRKLKG